MDDRKKKLGLVAILLVILVISWTIVLSPGKKSSVKPKTVTLPTSAANGGNSNGIKGNFSLVEVEKSVKETKSLLSKIEETEPAAANISLRRNPFNIERRPTSSISSEMTHSILKEARPRLSSFILSGILYDKTKPLAIINERVCAESERVEEYQVYRILPDQVWLKNNERTLVLKISSSGSTEMVEEKMVGERTVKETALEMLAVSSLEINQKKPEEVIPNKLSQERRIMDGCFFKTVQVFSVPQEKFDQARNEARQLAKQGFNRVRLLRDDEFIVLRVGNYRSLSEAKEVKARLTRRYPYA
ncbi:MAG: SPOR domain-containing protein, partial [Candidatus Omnitrophica bacterium]|nr:SPOR domain-containing protein [Candidatus Omnitrophota bacterium]